MTREEAKTIFLNRGYIESDGGSYFDGNKWRESIAVISEWLKEEPCEELDFVQPHKKMPVNLKVCKMREATQEEGDGIEQYIDSIAEPCEDAISRQAAIDAANKVIERDTSGNNDVVNAMIAWSEYIKSLPSVTPQEPFDEIINKTVKEIYVQCKQTNSNFSKDWNEGFNDGMFQTITIIKGIRKGKIQ